MADVSLNGLKVKTDSLPNDWYVSLINPKSDEPAEIMTVAKFAEMFLENNSVLTKNDEGVNGSLSASKSYKLVNIEEINDLNSIPDLGNPGLRIFNFRPSALNTPPKNDNSSILFHIDRGYYGSAGYYYSQLAFQSNGVFFREYHGNIDWGWKKLLFEETALQSNALTDTISDNYSILPPPPANCVPNYSESAGSSEQFAVSAMSETDNLDGSTPVKSESTEVQEQYVWSIDKIGKAVLELQEENKHLKQILASNGIEVNKE